MPRKNLRYRKKNCQMDTKEIKKVDCIRLKMDSLFLKKKKKDCLLRISVPLGEKYKIKLVLLILRLVPLVFLLGKVKPKLKEKN
jgi:hypothetical protein